MRINPAIVLCLTLLLCGPAGTGATEVYRWVDDDGNVIFSDVPRAGAERIEVGEVSTVPAQPVPPSASDAAGAGEGASGYTSLRIASPADEETIRNEQQLNVQAAPEPGLDVAAGHRIQFFFDGAPYGDAVAATSIVVQPLNRGTHQIGAAIVDARGKELQRADPITIYVHQTSVLTPRPAVRAPSGS